MRKKVPDFLAELTTPDPEPIPDEEKVFVSFGRGRFKTSEEVDAAEREYLSGEKLGHSPSWPAAFFSPGQVYPDELSKEEIANLRQLGLTYEEWRELVKLEEPLS